MDISALAPLAAPLAALSYRTWACVCVSASLLYLRHISALARLPRDAPCPRFGFLFRLLYGLFGTTLAQAALAYLLHTREGTPQPEQLGGTTPRRTGPAELRVKLLPILGSAFGGNYSFLIWDEADEARRALVVDPADPHPVLAAAAAEGLRVVTLLNTHWHLDHAAGNRTFARKLPGLQVVASSAERTRPPAVTTLVRDQTVLEVGRLRVRCHHVPGHTQGSLCFEVYNVAAPQVPHAVFTGDAIFCGGCGALFEGSAHVLHAALGVLVSRLPRDSLIFPGHEYTEMLLRMACQREPSNQAAAKQLAQACHARLLRAKSLPTIPTTLAQELEYNPYLRASAEQLARMCGCVEE
ncbi:hypothetical protein AB1Y20_003535 [Prymnesium parvum]|uniref:hydroxyacylglutathione hydrolase n=1 Tax=Prymnesium parvum TaxID=97485 RepID=A0AB34J5J8_PRYPA